MDPRTEVDVWTRHFEARKRELIREGMSPEAADDRASAEIRCEIRGHPKDEHSSDSMGEVCRAWGA